MKTFLLVVLPLIVLAGVGPVPRPGAATATEADTITIDNFTFQAATLNVNAGTRVTWVNRDDVPHKIVSTDKKFSSPVLDTDARFSFTFTAPGTYEYFCSIHPMMKGRVVVK